MRHSQIFCASTRISICTGAGVDVRRCRSMTQCAVSCAPCPVMQPAAQLAKSAGSGEARQKRSCGTDPSAGLTGQRASRLDTVEYFQRRFHSRSRLRKGLRFSRRSNSFPNAGSICFFRRWLCSQPALCAARPSSVEYSHAFLAGNVFHSIFLDLGACKQASLQTDSCSSRRRARAILAPLKFSILDGTAEILDSP